VQAGCAAGAHVAALKDPRFPFDQSRAEFHICSLEEIPQILNLLQKEAGR
jgi:beta-phosphoglucomutase-like phosphatase (HAD superfamily)